MFSKIKYHDVNVAESVLKSGKNAAGLVLRSEGNSVQGHKQSLYQHFFYDYYNYIFKL